MSRREIEQPTRNEHGDEEHPAWVMIRAGRVQCGPPGATLFDSDIRHMHTVRVRIATASRKRDLNRDWLHAGRDFVEVELSEAQWASFVSSMNTGNGVPATLRWHEGVRVPEVPYEPRLAESMEEVRSSAREAWAEVQAAFEVFEERPIKANRDRLKYAIKNAPANMTFAAKSLSEHAENVVQRARADVEAMVVSKAQQLGLDPAEVGRVMELEEGSGDA